MKKLFLLLFTMSTYLLTQAQSVTLTPNNINSRQGSLTDNIILQGTNPPNIVGIRHYGSLAAPTATLSGSFLLSIEGKGHNGTAIPTSKGIIRFVTTENWTPTANGTKLEFQTTANGTTSPATRMTIAHDGKVGVGTAIPAGKLHILHDGADSDPHMRIHTTGSWSRINWSTNTNANYWTAQSYLESATTASNYWRLEYNTLPKFTVNGDGDIGVGTGSPTAKLHVVHSGSDSDPHIRIHTTGAESRINWSTNTNANYWIAQSYLESATTTSNYWRLEYNGASRFFVRADGNVGIGTSTPDNKLDVLGVIRANEVIVETGWADYVFDDNFKLKPLTEVESFIKENKHLPDVPSAKTVQEKGAHVSELMTKMMQKIEELTLYSIQQQKEIDALKKQMIAKN